MTSSIGYEAIIALASLVFGGVQLGALNRAMKHVEGLEVELDKSKARVRDFDRYKSNPDHARKYYYHRVGMRWAFRASIALGVAGLAMTVVLSAVVSPTRMFVSSGQSQQDTGPFKEVDPSSIKISATPSTSDRITKVFFQSEAGKLFSPKPDISGIVVFNDGGQVVAAYPADQPQSGVLVFRTDGSLASMLPLTRLSIVFIFFSALFTIVVNVMAHRLKPSED